MQKLIKIKEDIFHSKLSIFISNDFKRLSGYFNKEEIKELQTCQGCFIGEDGINSIYLNEKRDIPLFIHELQHFITGEFKEFRGIDDNETRSYLMEYYTREFLSAIKKKNGKVGNKRQLKA